MLHLLGEWGRKVDPRGLEKGNRPFPAGKQFPFAVYRFAHENYFAFIRLQYSHYQIEECGFAGAVFPTMANFSPYLIERFISFKTGLPSW